MIGLVLTPLYTSSRKPTLNINSGSFSLAFCSFALVGNLLFAMLSIVESSVSSRLQNLDAVEGFPIQRKSETSNFGRVS
jgi:hypothetical protein